MSGCTLTYKFFSQKLGFQQLLSPKSHEKLIETLKYVEDHDIKGGKHKNSEPFVADLYKRQLNLDVKQNQLIFLQLLKINLENSINSGN